MSEKKGFKILGLPWWLLAIIAAILVFFNKAVLGFVTGIFKKTGSSESVPTAPIETSVNSAGD